MDLDNGNKGGAPWLLFLLVLAAAMGESKVAGGGRARSSSRQYFEKAAERWNTTVAKDSSQKKGKLFSLFNVVTFQNGPCASTATVNGRSRNGTCFTNAECADKGGMVQGNCAAGFGVCCVFVVNSEMGGAVNQNCTYIQNNGFPAGTTTTTALTYTVTKCSADVCTLCLDFETFNLVGTNGSANDNEGDCIDTFSVTTSSTGKTTPTICGLNTGQHMYVDIGANAGDTATLTFGFGAAVTTARMFDIKVTQLECGNQGGPRDPGCLQYHTSCTGRIETFNYQNVNDNHLNNQQYSICIRQEEGFCCIEYRVCPDQLTLLPGGQQAGFSFDTVTIADKFARHDNLCDSTSNSFDYIGIPDSSFSCSRAGDSGCRAVHGRYCGTALHFQENAQVNIPICDCTPPFNVHVHFNNNDDSTQDAARNDGMVNAKQSRGLCLEYEQKRC